MKTALVTGGAGFIGSHLVDLLLAKNNKVIVIDNFTTGRRENLDHVQDRTNLEIIQHDLAHPGPVLDDAVSRADYVFHLAALADIVPSINFPDQYYRSNVDGTFNVLEACRKHGRIEKFLYAASSSCYGIPDQYPTPENAEMRPQYPYALTKMLGEQLAIHWGKVYKIPVVSLRLFNVFGPRSRTSGTYGAVFGVFLAQKLANKPFTVVGDGTQTRDFTYVSNVADAFWTASQSSTSGETFNVGSGNHYSVNCLVNLLGGEVIYIPKRPGEPDCTFADTKKINSVLNWKPTTSFEEGVAEVLRNIDYWRAAPVWTPESIKETTKVWFESLS